APESISLWRTGNLHPAGQWVCIALWQRVELEPTTTAKAHQLCMPLASPRLTLQCTDGVVKHLVSTVSCAGLALGAEHVRRDNGVRGVARAEPDDGAVAPGESITVPVEGLPPTTVLGTRVMR